MTKKTATTRKTIVVFPYTYISADGKHKTVHGVCYRCGYRITRKRNLALVQEKRGGRRRTVHTRCIKPEDIW